MLLMIEAHVVDAWTKSSARGGQPFEYAILLGGFAAPMFLWLAGVGVAFSAVKWTRSQSRSTAVEAICRRGLEIFLLAFLFRLQAFVVTPGRGSHLVTLFRVDILNVMGPAIVAAGLLWAVSSRPAMLVAVYASAATATAMVTPLVRSWPLVGVLPVWLQWYLRPAGDYTTFTLFPWAGFVFAGAACGVVLAQTHDARSESRAHVALAATGAAVLAFGFLTAGRPSLYASSSFWTSSPTYFAIRAGGLTMVLSALYAASRALDRLGIELVPLARFGRGSLFIYWIHVELVYGYATWPIHHRLPLWGAAVAYLAFCALMYRTFKWRDRVVAAYRGRRYGGSDQYRNHRASDQLIANH